MIVQKLPASADRAYALLTDSKWLESRSAAMGELSASCRTKKTPSVVVTMKRRVRRELNALVSKVLNPESDIEIEEQWSAVSDGYKGQYRFRIASKPINASADFELFPDGKGCVYRIRHRAKVNVPLIGGVVEKFVIGQVEQGCSDELAYLADYLKTHN